MFDKAAYADMVKTLAKDGKAIADSMTAEGSHLLHMALGVSGEAGELAEPVFNHFVLGEDLDTENLLEEIGDIEFYLEGARHGMGVSIDDIKAHADYHRDPLAKGILNGPGVDASASTSVKAMVAVMQIQIHEAAFLDVVKKRTVYNKPIETEVYLPHMAKLESWIDTLCDTMGIDRDIAKQKNMDKLLTGKNARYKSGSYSDEQAQLRRDKQDETAA